MSEVPHKKIFVITAIKFGYKKRRNIDGEVKRYFTIIRERVWGWFADLETTQKAVDENWMDMYENGHYPWIVIEKTPEGICSIGPVSEYWYKWSGDDKTGKYKPTKKPKSYNNVVGFGIG
jgi:hypothetical protein